MTRTCVFPTRLWVKVLPSFRKPFIIIRRKCCALYLYVVACIMCTAITNLERGAVKRAQRKKCASRFFFDAARGASKTETNNSSPHRSNRG